MAQNRFYSSVAVKTTLNGSITAGATTMTVTAATGFPASLPFTLILERDTANEEVVTVTAVSSLTLTVSRAQDGTTGVSHATGAVVEHGVSARDFNEPQAHIAASSAVHGITGSVVGTSDAQTLTNKSLTGAVLDSTSTLGGVDGGSLGGAWTAYTPTFTGITSPTGVFRSRLVGKTLTLWFYFTGGTSSASQPKFTLPSALVAANIAGTGQSAALQAFGLYQPGTAFVSPNLATVSLQSSALPIGTAMAGWGATLTIEVA